MDNIVLIGMPSSGKSTAGYRLAEILGFGFLDCDAVIENEEGVRLPDLIEREGAEGFLEIERRVNEGIAAHRCVISTGGSVCYLPSAMEHLKSIGIVVYLRIGAEEIKRRVPSLEKRGVVMRGGVTTVEELLGQRAPLYAFYADVTVDCEGKTAEELAEEIGRISGFYQ